MKALTVSSWCWGKRWCAGDGSIQCQDVDDSCLQLAQDQHQLPTHTHCKPCLDFITALMSDVLLEVYYSALYLVHGVLGNDLDCSQGCPQVHEQDRYRPQSYDCQDTYKWVDPYCSSSDVHLKHRQVRQPKCRNCWRWTALLAGSFGPTWCSNLTNTVMAVIHNVMVKNKYGGLLKKAQSIWGATMLLKTTRGCINNHLDMLI